MELNESSVNNVYLVQVLRQDSEVSSLDVSRDWLAASSGRKLSVWRWETSAGWSLVASAKQAHKYCVTTVKWSLHGILLATGGVDGAVRVWAKPTTDLEVKRELVAPGAATVRAINWAGPGTVIIGHDDGAICIWKVMSNRLQARLIAHEAPIHAVCTLGKGVLLATACTYGVFKLHLMTDILRAAENANAAEVKDVIPIFWEDGAHDLGAYCATEQKNENAFSKDASIEWMIATGGHDGIIKVWKVSLVTAKAVKSLFGHSGPVTALAWTSRVLASSSMDRTVRLWSTSGSCLQVVQAHSRYLTSIALDDDFSYIVSGSNDKTLRTWSLSDMTLEHDLKIICSLETHYAIGDLEGIVPINDDDDVVIPSVDCEEGMVSIWGPHFVHDGPINAVVWRDSLMVSASSDGRVNTYNWNGDKNCPQEERLQLRSTMDGHAYPVLCVDVTLDGKYIVSGGLDGQAVVWDVEEHCRIGSVSCSGEGGGIRAAKISSTSPYLLSVVCDGGRGASIYQLNPVPSPRPIVTFSEESTVTVCVWSHDGLLLVTGSDTGIVDVHSTSPIARSLLHFTDAHEQGIQSCDFSPSVKTLDLEDDGQNYILVTGSDYYVKIWLLVLSEEFIPESATMKCLKKIWAHSGTVSTLRVNANGNFLASGGDDRWTRLWMIQGDTGPAVTAKSSITSLEINPEGHLAIGTLTGELVVYRIKEDVNILNKFENNDEDLTLNPRIWSKKTVLKWFNLYVIKAPDNNLPLEQEEEIINKIKESEISGKNLLNDPIEDIVEVFGETKLAREVAEKEIETLRTVSLTATIHRVEMDEMYKCPFTHRVMSDPVKMSDGYTYERGAIVEWFVSAGNVSPLTGEKLRCSSLSPNYRLRNKIFNLNPHNDNETL